MDSVIQVVAALIRAEDRFMICRRPEGKARAMLWEFPGGKIEPGETPRQALVRECREELDITVEPGGLFFETMHDYPDISVHLMLFEAVITQGEPKKLEHSDIRWIVPEQIKDYEFCPADREILAHILARRKEEAGKKSVLREINGRRCRIFIHGEGGPALYSASFSGEDEARMLDESIEKLCPGYAWTLIAFETRDWDSELTPWPASGAMRERKFAGEAKETAAWLISAAKLLENELGCRQRAVGGYSLAGLFALWVFYESGVFDGAASCSGSLWYPGWSEYAEKHRAKCGSAVYLSLGKAEEKSRNPVLARVGDETRRQYERLRADEGIARCELVWHEGGHFNGANERSAQGFAWLIKNLQDKEDE